MLLRKFVEDLGFGRVSPREAYTANPDLLPLPVLGARWHEVAFDEAEAVDREPGLLHALDNARRYGVEIIERGAASIG